MILGILVLMLGLYPLFIIIKRKIQCTKFVMGRIIDKYIGDTVTDQYPIYEYEVQGKIYKKQSKQRDSYVQIGKKLKYIIILIIQKNIWQKVIMEYLI